jgi:hypothetical protein
MDLEPPGEPALFTAAEVTAPGLTVFRRRVRHSRTSSPAAPAPRVWAAAHRGARGRAPSGTVHLVNEEWLPACGTGLNGWDYRGLQATDEDVSCRRCGDAERRRAPEPGQLALFPIPPPAGR